MISLAVLFSFTTAIPVCSRCSGAYSLYIDYYNWIEMNRISATGKTDLCCLGGGFICRYRQPERAGQNRVLYALVAAAGT